MTSPPCAPRNREVLGYGPAQEIALYAILEGRSQARVPVAALRAVSSPSLGLREVEQIIISTTERLSVKPTHASQATNRPRNRDRSTAHLSRWLEEVQKPPSDLTAERVEAFLEHRRNRGYTRWRTKKGVAPILDILRNLGVLPPVGPVPIDESLLGELLRNFERYLLEERGIQPITVDGYIRLVRPFAEGLDLPELEQLSTEAVLRFILTEARSSETPYLKRKVTALRSFLRYLHVAGHCRDFSAAVPAVAGYRRAGLPRAIPEEDVRKIEQSCDRGSAAGRGNYAILLLLSRLGLRAGEVAALKLDDVRWARGEIVIRGKASQGILPLPEEVGEALVEYLKDGRRASHTRKLFLQVSVPHGELSAAGASRVFRRACQKAGLEPMGAHRLRHTAATVMLRKAASLPEIAQVLRHANLMTTAIYPKVDFQALRPLARSWPGGAA